MRGGKGTTVAAVPIKTIHQLRDELGFRIEDVVTEGKLSLGTYLKIDNGTTKIENLTINTFIHLAHGLRRSPAELLQDLGLDIKPEF